MPYRQRPLPSLTVAVRTAGDPNAYATQMRRAVQSVDPDQPIANVRTMDELIAQRSARASSGCASRSARRAPTCCGEE